jgi:hypothetical protein
LSFQALFEWFNQSKSKSSNVKQQDTLLVLSTIEKLFFTKAKLFSQEILNSSEAQSMIALVEAYQTRLNLWLNNSQESAVSLNHKTHFIFLKLNKK